MGKTVKQAVAKRRRACRGIYWYLFSALCFLELLMSFSFLGYIHIPPISITFVYIPVLVAGCLFGPGEATILGVLFGLASMWKASAPYVMDGDKIFSPTLSGEPLSSLILSIGTRALFGLVTGLLYLLAKRARRWQGFWIGVVSCFGKTIHSLFVYTAMGLLFPEFGRNAADAFLDWATLENLLFVILTIGLVLICWKLYGSAPIQNMHHQLQAAQQIQNLQKGYKNLYLWPVAIGTILASGTVGFYFVHRIYYMLEGQGAIWPKVLTSD